MAQYKKILIKLSGRAVAGSGEFGFNSGALEHIAREILSVKEIGIGVSVLIGGGNIFRGSVATEWGFDRAEADNIGMLATVMNSLLLRGVLRARGTSEVRVMSALKMDPIAEPYIRLRAVHHLEKDYIIIFAAGNGQPFTTTDYPAVQRAVEVGCDALLVAKHGVDGVYESDPKHDPKARRYRRLSYEDSIQKNLRVMDQSALILAREYSLPLHVFNFEEQGFMKRICLGETGLGTFVGSVEKSEFY